MQQTSYNGCPATPSPTNVDRSWGVEWNGKKIIFPQGLGQTQDMRDCFQYLMEQWIHRVEPPITGDYATDGDWGGEFRANVNNPSTLSCHASWSAIDYLATRHPNGSRNTYTAAQYKTIAEILEELEGVITVGIPGLRTTSNRLVGWTTSSRPDEMHKEATRYDLIGWARVAGKVRPKLGKGAQGTPAPQPPQTHEGAITAAGVTVKQVQKALNRNGAKLVVDGIIGPLTVAAIRSYQASHKLRVDGIVGPVTWASLKKLLFKPKPTPMAYPLKNGQVFGTWNKVYQGVSWAARTRSGDPRYDGADIRNLVKLIQAKVGVKQDGIYGPVTDAAVVKYQRAHGLTPDGMVGKATWTKLFA